MTSKEAKSYLMQYRQAAARLHAISDHIADLRAAAEQLRTEDGHRFALDKAVAELVDASEQAAAEVAQLCRTECEISAVINRVAEPYRTLLYERYINGKTFEQIAVGMLYSWRQIVRLHGQALQYAQNVIECHMRSVL